MTNIKIENFTSVKIMMNDGHAITLRPAEVWKLAAESSDKQLIESSEPEPSFEEYAEIERSEHEGPPVHGKYGSRRY